tara:strand:+ start:1000 stop:3279 length:2280 start_codon:yes stop_codon:yes gene_type:complete
MAYARPTNWKGSRPVLIAPVQIDNVHVDDIWISPQSGDIFLDQDKIFELLEKFLTEDEFEEVKEIRSPLNYLKANELKKFGLNPVFDYNELIFYLKIPLNMRKENFLEIESSDMIKGFVVKPAPFSYFLNFDYQNNYTSGLSESEQIYNELNFNYKGHILNSAGFASSENNERYFRDYTRYIKDFKQNHVRLVLGDLSHNTVDLQQQIQGAGLSIQNEFSIAPNTLRTNFNRYEVNLNEPSRIEIFVNEQRVYQGYHQAGVLNLNKLPLFIGQNNIKVVATTQNGRVENFYFSNQYHNNLLPVGLSDYAFNIFDKSSRNDEGDLTYDEEERFFSGYFRYGLTDSLTLGVNNQSEGNNSMTGFQFSTSLGRILTEYYHTYSQHQEQNANSFLFSMQSLVTTQKIRPIRFNANYRFFEKDFYYIDGRKNSIKTSKNLSSSYLLSSLSSLGLGVEEQVNYNNSKSEFMNVEFLYRFNINANFSIKQQIDIQNSENNSVLLTFNWFEPMRKFSGFHSYEDENHKMRHQVNYNDTFKASRLQLSSTYENETHVSTELATLYGNYETNYGSIRLDHTQADTESFNTLNLRFALVGVGARPYFSPYINESFVITRTNTESEILLANGNIGYLSNRNNLVFADLTSYRTNTVNLDLNNLEYGEDLAYDRLTLFPEYKAGMIAEVEVDKNLSLRFKLKSADRNKIKYQSITIRGEDEEIELLSGKNGLVFIPAIKPGEYDILLNGEQIFTFTTKKTLGVENIGDINVD